VIARCFLIGFALLAGCGDDRCLPCKGALSSAIRYDCDAGECPGATAVYQCTCRVASDVSIWTHPASDTCEAATASWQSFKASACR
jgi:hypothetical protein